MGMNIQTSDFHGQKTPPDATIASVIVRHVASRPGSPVFITSRDDVLTYGALGAQIEAVGSVLRASGIGPKSRVAIILPDGIEFAIGIVVVACHAIAVPVNPRMTATEIDN